MNRKPALTLAVDMLLAVANRDAQGAPSPAPRSHVKPAFPINRYPALTLALELLLIMTVSYGPLLLSISL